MFPEKLVETKIIMKDGKSFELKRWENESTGSERTEDRPVTKSFYDKAIEAAQKRLMDLQALQDDADEDEEE